MNPASTTDPNGVLVDRVDIESVEVRATGSVVDVMSSPAFAVDSATTLTDVLQTMLSVDRRHLVVVDLEGRCIGVLGDRTVAAAWATDPTTLSRISAGQAVRDRPSVASIQASVRDVAELMISNDVDAIAVVDADARPVGVVTGSDLVGLIARTHRLSIGLLYPTPRPAHGYPAALLGPSPVVA